MTSRGRLVAALAAAAAAAAQAQPAPSFDLGDENRIAAGKRRFGSTCAAYCHGAEGVGGRAPSLKGNPHFTPEATYKVIAEGRRGSGVMPPWGGAFSSEQIWELVAYLQVLSQQPAP
jgi:mono/diheme cytochrome c family protein